MALATAFTLPSASADLVTVNVTLANGTTVPVQVNVPPGTPLENIHIPPVTTPTVPVQVPAPTPTTPTTPTTPVTGGGGGNSGSGNSGNSGSSGSGSSGNSSPQPDSATPSSPSAQTPTATKGGKQKSSGSKKHAPTLDVNLKPDKSKTKTSGPTLYQNNGAPAASNPTFIDALPGPAQVTSVPNFVIQQFRVPPFLLPIYQAAGIQYGIRWEVLAAINEIETDYGRNLNVSSAGAVGWMQFLPSTWKT